MAEEVKLRDWLDIRHDIKEVDAAEKFYITNLDLLGWNIEATSITQKVPPVLSLLELGKPDVIFRFKEAVLEEQTAREAERFPARVLFWEYYSPVKDGLLQIWAEA